MYRCHLVFLFYWQCLLRLLVWGQDSKGTAATPQRDPQLWSCVCGYLDFLWTALSANANVINVVWKLDVGMHEQHILFLFSVFALWVCFAGWTEQKHEAAFTLWVLGLIILARHKCGPNTFSAQGFGLQERVLKLHFCSLTLVLWLGKRRDSTT